MSVSSNASMHPIMNSVVHHSFKSASKDVGCCEFTEQNFVRAVGEHLPLLTEVIGKTQIDLHRLWTSMMTGEVIAVEFNAGTLVFHVQGKAFGLYIDMRFTYQSDIWTIASITSVHTRPIWRSRILTTALALVVGMVATGCIGYAMAAERAPVSEQAVKSWASVHGYTLIPNTSATSTTAAAFTGNQTANQTVGGTANGSTTSTPDNTPFSGTDASGNSAGSSNSSTAASASTDATGNSVTVASSGSANANSSGSASNPKAPQSFTFHFQSGMTVHDISVFLQQHHLISNSYAFDQVLHKTGVDKSIWPGTYTFTSKMTQSQILQELKTKPKH